MKNIMLLAMLMLVPACASKEEAVPAADSTAVDTLVVPADSTAVITLESSAMYTK